jgi:aldehyde dehydrogenase (NAD+)
MTILDHRAEVRRLFDAQVANRWAVAASTAAQRIERLSRLREAVRSHRLDLVEALRADFGKQPVETELTEYLPVIEELSTAIRELPRWMRPRRVGTPLSLFGTRSEVRPEAKGVVLVLSPWNYPFNLAMVPLVAALAAGNTVMLRPSEKTPHTSRLIHGLLAKVFPENEVAVLEGEVVVAEALLELPFDQILYTGGARVGRLVMAAAARHLTPVTLELGGKCPAVVDETADLELAAERITWSKFINAGQTCLAPDYVLVQETVAPRLEAALKAAVERLYGADEAGRLQNPDLACLIDSASTARLERALAETLGRGARLVVGGRSDVAARRMSPTVLADVPADSAIMAGEIFGPVLPLLRYRELGEAVAAIQARPKPLGLYLFSRSKAKVEQLLLGTSAGGTCINNALLHFANPNLPFGGVGESGMGSYHGRWGFDSMSHFRAVLRQVTWSGTSLLYPPFTPKVAGFLSILRRLVG